MNQVLKMNMPITPKELGINNCSSEEFLQFGNQQIQDEKEEKISLGRRSHKSDVSHLSPFGQWIIETTNDYPKDPVLLGCRLYFSALCGVDGENATNILSNLRFTDFLQYNDRARGN